MNRISNLDQKTSIVAYIPQTSIINKPFLKVPHARNQKRLFVYYAVLALILVFFQLFFTTSASAFQIGDRVQATDNLNVRNCPFLTCNIIGVIPSGGAGKIINGSYFFDNYTWWYIGWDNGLTGYSVQNYLTVIPGTLPASFTLNQPSTSCNSTNPQISLSWGSSSGATSYNVYRNGAFYANAFTSLTYNNTSVISGTTYTYFIRASNSAGYRNSNTVTVTAPNCVASPQITIGPSSLNFGSVQAGSCSSAQFAVQHVLNTGTASGTVTISQSAPFRITSNGSFSLSNGQAVNVGVEFCPTSSSSFSRTAVISSNANQNINSVNLSGTGFIPSPTTGAIQVNAKLDGAPWTGSVNYSISGAQNFSGNTVSADFQDRPQGNYTLAYVSGGPANSTFSSITPSNSQTLNGGGVITFTLNFIVQTSNQSPVSRFTMTSGDKIVYETQTLNLTVSSGGTAQVSFSGSRSSDPDGSISSYLWKINGAQVSTSRDFSSSLGEGTHQVYLTVTDNQGAEGSVGGTVVVTEQTSNQSPEAKFAMTSGGQTAYENQTLDLTVSSGGTAQVSFSGSRSSDPDGSISSYLWKINGAQVSTSRDFISSSLGKGTHQVYLTVTDNQGAEGSVGGTVVVAEQTSNQSPEAKFAMTSGGQTAYENQTLNLTVSSGGTAQVSFSGSRSSDPDGSISSYLWKINGAQVSTSRDFDYSLAEGTHQVYLTVTDNQGAEGSVGASIDIIPDLDLNGSCYKTPDNEYCYKYGGQCTAFAWGRACEKTGIKLKFKTAPYPNANYWYIYGPEDSLNLNTGTTIQPDSIAVWGGDLSKSEEERGGHVAYVERVVDGTVYFNEANVETYIKGSDWGGGYDGYEKSRTVYAFEHRGGDIRDILGYIYLSSFPMEPTLTVTTSGTTVTVSWASVTTAPRIKIAGATGYTLSYAPYPYTGPDSIGNVDMGSQTGASFDLWGGAAFYVAVQAYNSAGSSGYSNIEYFVIGSSISVIPTTLSITVGETGTCNISNGTSPYIASSSNTSVATVSVSGSTLSVTGVSAGSATITVTDSAGDLATVSMTVSGGTPTTYTNSLGQTFVLLPAGAFTMGSPSDEPGRFSNEGPQHQVTLTQPFYMQTTEVTQAQWEAVMGSNPAYFSGCPTCPVESVAWNDVQQYVVEMNKLGEGTYSLPTEAQWEYAARAGSTTAFANGGITELNCGYDPNLDAMGWYCYNSGDETLPAGQKAPNAWGLYDMLGNAPEWCQDWYATYSSSAVTNPTGPSSGSYRVIRSGRWTDYARNCRSAYRGIHDDPIGYSLYTPGFRLLRQP